MRRREHNRVFTSDQCCQARVMTWCLDILWRLGLGHRTFKLLYDLIETPAAFSATFTTALKSFSP